MEANSSSSGNRARHRARLLWLPLASALAFALAGAGCASAGVEFRPYLSAMPHKPMLTRAVSVDRRDVPALAQAGGIIIGHISAHGTGYAARDLLEETAAVEAARRGGTHLVAETPRTAAQREVVQLDVSYLVVRLADVEAMAQLSLRLRPHRGVHYLSVLESDRSELEQIPAPDSAEPEHQPRVSVRVVDGRNLKPLSPAESR
ncbi:MAG TPA: hypothetical protein VK509_16135 [Polyangiales bacterium]|nr:hypothetical protein [Polyangiales bacterium]